MRLRFWQQLGLAILPLGIPVATLWVRYRERIACAKGRKLTPLEMEDARAAGVRFPERVRVLAVPRIVLFENPSLNRWIATIGDAFGPTIGLTVRYGILVKQGWQEDRRLIVHELAHVAQYERLGGIGRFLLRYFRECIRDGYPNSVLEREASSTALRVCGGREG